MNIRLPMVFGILWAVGLPVTGAYALTIGDRIQASANLNIRSSASTSGSLLGTAAAGAQGEIIGGPTSANGYTWWRVDWDSYSTGWSVADYMTKVTGSSPGNFTLSNSSPIWDTSPPAGPAVQLSWTSSSNATSYEIYRNGSKIYPTSGTFTGTSFRNETGLTGGQSYSYYVIARNASGSRQSNTLNITMPNAPPATPATPGYLEGQFFAYRVELGWTDQSSNEQGFKVERRIGSGSWSQIATVGAVSGSGSSVFWTDNTASPKTSYSYRVYAYNAQGNSGYTNTTSLTTPAGRPGSFTLSSQSPVWDASLPGPKVQLTWTASADAGGYALYRDGSLYISGISGTSFLNQSGLNAGQTYTYHVRASNSEGTTDSNTITVTMPPAPPSVPVTPYNLAAAVSGQAIQLTWTDASNNEQGFKIERRPFWAPGWAALVTLGANVTSYVDTTVAASESYVYRVRAYNNVGPSNYSNDATVTSAPLILPPDITPENYAISKASGGIGTAFNVTYNLQNQGGTASQAFTTRIRLSASSSKPSSSDPVLKEFQSSGMAVGEVRSENRSVIIPSGTSVGKKYIWLVIDAESTAGQDATGESNDSVRLLFTVTAPSPAISLINGGVPVVADFNNDVQTIDIDGSGFVSKPTVSVIWSGGGKTLSSSQVTFVNEGKLQIHIQLGKVADIWSVQVKNPDGQPSSPTNFTVTTATDHTLPTVTSFTAQSLAVSDGESVNLRYTVADSGGGGLDRVELWRTKDAGGQPEGGNWQKVKQNPASGYGPVQGAFSDELPSVGVYWYGIHVVDKSNNTATETTSGKAPLRIERLGDQESAFSFSFPLSGYDPYTAQIVSVFDHANNDEAKVIAYTGEMGDVVDYNESSSKPYSFKKSDGSSFRINGYYQGTQMTGPGTLNYDGHRGYDYKVEAGTLVCAAADGIVVKTDPDNTTAAGKFIRLDHADVGYQTQYLHLSRIDVTVGQQITRGDVIGLSGNTAGAQSVGAHLHFEVKKRDGEIPVDPYGWAGQGPDPYTRATNRLLWQKSRQPKPKVKHIKPYTVTGSKSAQEFTLEGEGLTHASTIEVAYRDTNYEFVKIKNKPVLNGDSQMTFRLTVGLESDTWQVRVNSGSGPSNIDTFTVIAPTEPKTPSLTLVNGGELMRFDRPRYFTLHELHFGVPSADQRSGLETLLSYIENDPGLPLDANFKHLRWAAYILATTRHETGRVYQPIPEKWDTRLLQLRDAKPAYAAATAVDYFNYWYAGVNGNGNEASNDGYTYRGRGYVQLTGRGNYSLLGRSLGIDLEHDPDKALVADVSYRIMSHGMLHGSFTGVGLGNYITDTVTDYFNARKVVNGLDKAESIGDAATRFESILRESLINTSSLLVAPELETSVSATTSLSVSSDLGVTYSAKGLPSGMKIDAKTGVISGNATKVGRYSIAVSASNAAGSSEPLVLSLDVDSLPQGVIGSFEALVSAQEGLNDNLGGRLQLNVTTAGQVSGRLTLGDVALPFRAFVDMQPGDIPRIKAQLARKGLQSVQLDLELDPTAGTLAGIVTAGTDSASVEGYRNPWAAGGNVWAGYYTQTLDLIPESVGDPGIPQGNGWASLKVDAKGNARWAGVLADGTKITSASVTSADGRVTWYNYLYGKEGGSVVGQAQITSAEGSPLDGVLDWVKKPSASSKVRSYRQGFGLAEPVALALSGGLYTAPAGAVLGVADTSPNVRVSFAEGGIEQSAVLPDVALQVDVRNRVLLPAAEANPGRLKLSLKASTGYFSGGFQVADQLSSDSKPLVRSAAFQGMLVPRLGLGAGFFLLPQMPDATATPPTTAKTSPILSGQVLFEPFTNEDPDVTAFTDDFNRADAAGVGNGWLNATSRVDKGWTDGGAVSGTLRIVNQCAENSQTTGTAAIYRGFDHSAGVRVKATFSHVNGFGSLQRRFLHCLGVRSNGQIGDGLAVMFYRADQGYSNSTVLLFDGATEVAKIATDFQFSEWIRAEVEFRTDGSVQVNVANADGTEGQQTLSFPARPVNASGSNVIFVVNGCSGPLKGWVDDVTLEKF
ncbi:Putative Ig domain-containing protein [Prosthecobacter debontii]|uniref:Putative Ig domain-containing protein n=1 Tax=Prosthecobacter debontii TaxID=48467 RepID=A0A1T4Y0S0_9BACT|nr:peptidoglycan DD-metalloendopeptidase family protein [Prosthecobacter debontii]SKA95078.1 Putative Ig domain-containing protein [Prosthecobacter debontii]